MTTYEVVKAEAGDWMGGVATGVHRVHWFRIVLDEAHYIRNLGAGCQAACKLEADFRWCLTGTPIVNKADDIYALYRFLRYPTFERKSIFDEYIGRKVRRTFRRKDETEMDLDDERREGLKELRMSAQVGPLRADPTCHCVKAGFVAGSDGSIMPAVAL